LSNESWRDPFDYFSLRSVFFRFAARDFFRTLEFLICDFIEVALNSSFSWLLIAKPPY
jgi:hypothetical protein